MGNIYFLGCSSARGFQTKFQDIINRPGYFSYILKGGPGTGKSTLMKKLAKQFEGEDTDIYYCSSDIKSVDAVVIHGHKTVIVDGTAPHVFNADYPGVSQTLVDLGRCWDMDKIKEHGEEIYRCFKENAGYHKRARSFVTAMSEVNGSILERAGAAMNIELIEARAADLAKSITGSITGDVYSDGSALYSQLAAISSEGYFTQENEGYRRIAIADEKYAAGFEMLKMLKGMLMKSGIHMIISENQLFPKAQIEHLLIPRFKIQLSVIHPLNKLSIEESVDCSKMYEETEEREEYGRARHILLGLEREAAYSIQKALEIHDELESYYISALNFKELDRVTRDIIDEISGL